MDMGLRKFEIGKSLFVCLIMLIPLIITLTGVSSNVTQNQSVFEQICWDQGQHVQNIELWQKDGLSFMLDNNNDHFYEKGIIIANEQERSQNFKNELPDLFKPGHIDLAFSPIGNEIIKTKSWSYPSSFEPRSLFSTPRPDQLQTRQIETVDDLELWNIQWEIKHTGWCEVTDPDSQDYPEDPTNWYTGNQASTGSFKVGVTTKITVTVKNNGDDTINNIPVNLSVIDLIHDQPMRPSPETKVIPSIGPDQTGTVIYDFKPSYASTYVRISAEVDWIDDGDDSNNAFSWTGIRICKWWDDLEAGTTGWSHNARDDLISASDDDWHLTTTAYAQGDNTHTLSNSWYLGNNDGLGAIYPLDSYRNNNAQSLCSPAIDLGNNVDERYWNQNLGTITGGPYEGYSAYLYHLTSVNWLSTGVTEEDDSAQNMTEYIENSDVLITGDISDDGGSSWNNDFSGVSGGRMGDIGETQWYSTTFIGINSQTQSVYYYPGVPLNYDVSNWNNVMFRHTFQSDNDSIQEIGYYLDDFVIYGNDNYTIKDRLGITEITYPETDGVPILYKDSNAELKVNVKNYGGEQSSVPVNMWVTDTEGYTLDQYSKQNFISNLGTDAEGEVLFSFSFEEQGDYTLWLEAGDQESDWTPTDNLETIYVHVRAGIDDSDVDILVVDDDDSSGQMGMYTVNVEDKMLMALDDNDFDYRVYTVEYNDSGPTADIMSDYALVIWLTGLDNADWGTNDKWPITLKDDDINELSDYLSSGGKLWLISPGFFYDYYGLDYESIAPTDFANNYLRIVNCQANLTKWNNDNTEILTQGTPQKLEGVDDTIMAGVEFMTYNARPPKAFTDIGGAIEKKEGDKKTDTIFYQDSAHLQHNALFYKGTDYQVITFAFNFYLISPRSDREDCVWRALIGFELAGGVQIDLITTTSRTKVVYPDNSTIFQLKVTNTGKKPDTIELSSEVIYPSGYPGKYKTWHSEFIGNDVKLTNGKSVIDLAGLQTKNNIYLKVTAPQADDYSAYAAAGEGVQFSIKALSQNTKLDNWTSCYAQIPSLGRISIECSDTEESIKVEEDADFELTLYNETNDDLDNTVELSYYGPGEDMAKFYINNVQSSKKKITTVLLPNSENNDVSIKMTPDMHTVKGYYNITVFVKDLSGDVVFDTVTLSTYIEQFYQVVCNTTGDDDGKTNFVIDPNGFKEEFDDHIKKTFNINVRNFGNGYDKIGLSWHENVDSADTSNWPTPMIYQEASSGQVEIITVDVKYYDESKSGEKYGEEQVKFDVFIPLEIEVGTYIMDFVITSHGTESGGQFEVKNNIVSFRFDIVKPNLVFTKFDKSSTPNFEFFDSYDGLQINEDFERGVYYIEKKQAEFDYFELEIVLYIANSEESEFELAPDEVWLNITHLDDNGNLIYDRNFSVPDIPTSETPVGQEQKVRFRYRWVPTTEPATKPVEYTIKVTVDPRNEIYETDESDNSAELQITIKNIKNAEEPPIETNYLSLILIIVVILVVIVLIIVFLIMRKKPVKDIEGIEKLD